ncbi:MAG: hypothetical protein JRF20_05985 [Deltaproteobacteria bacterium]|nr:hypothetical protein [Deltaproteobacteria bacterium]MBW1965323.1 hypothetical protein [Deltaproteobacteria bacterium]MBW2350728.1 hypothetical protein [Deltaproteobacteria bacterium]
MSYEINPQKIRVKTIDGLEIEGMMNTGKEKRVSDHLMKDKPFITVYEATNTDIALKGIKKTFIIAKTNIAWVEPI